MRVSGYIYFTEEQKQRANAVDLEDFLTRRGEKLLRSGRDKRLGADHSITIRGNRWYDHAAEKGGYAIDFVQMFYHMTFPEAVGLLLGGEQGDAYRRAQDKEPEPPKPFVLPKAHTDMRRVYAYLTRTRCLNKDIVSAFVKAKMIYEDAKYHNAVFVGYDAQGTARHAHKRGTYTRGEPFKGNVEGADPRYSFHWIGKSDTVYVFEAPIDMLSFITMCRDGWKEHSYVSLCGVAEHALVQLLSDAPQVRRVLLCLDNDEAGHKAARRIAAELLNEWNVTVSAEFPSQKDWNDELLTNRQEEAQGLTMSM